MTAVLAIAVFAAEGVRADGWTLSGSATQRFSADTNLRLDPDDPGASYGSTTSVGLSLGSRNSRSNLSINPSVTGSLYKGDTGGDLDRIYPSIRAGYGHRFSSFSLNAGVSAQARQTAFSTFGVEDIDFDNDISGPDETDTDSGGEDTDSGGETSSSGSEGVSSPDLTLIDKNATQISVRSNLGGSYQLDSRNSFSGGLNYGITRYTNGGSNLSPSTSYGVSAGYSRQLTNDMSARVGAGARRTKITGNSPSKSWVYNVNGGLRGQVSNRMSINGNLGLSYLTRKDVSSTGITGTGNVGISYRMTSDFSMSFGGSQAIEPSSDGTLQTRSSLYTSAQFAINSRERVNGSFSYSRQKTARGFDDSRGSSTDDRFYGSLGYSIGITRDFGMNVGYNFSAKPSGTSAEAVSHGIGVSFSNRFALQD